MPQSTGSGGNSERIIISFCSDTSLHGLRHLANKNDSNSSLWEKLLWITVFLTAAGTATFMIWSLWSNYVNGPIITVFSPERMSITDIPFPAVTICSVNRIRASEVERLQGVAVTTEGKSQDSEQVAAAKGKLIRIESVCRSRETFSRRFGGTENHLEELTRWNKKHIGWTGSKNKYAEGYTNTSQSCSMILHCLWRDEVIDCDDLFQGMLTDYGFCCTFNALPFPFLQRNDNRFRVVNPKMLADWEEAKLSSMEALLRLSSTKKNNQSSGIKYSQRPHRQMFAGRSAGLSFLLNPDVDNYFCGATDSEGFILGLGLPFDSPRLNDRGVAIRTDAEVFVSVRPQITLAEPSITPFPVKERRCYLEGEVHLEHYTKYTMSNCVDECIAKMTRARCGCVYLYMPRKIRNTTTDKECLPYTVSCGELVQRNFSREGLLASCPTCLPTCTEIEYFPMVSYLHLQKDRLHNLLKNSGRSYVKKPTMVHVYLSVGSTYPLLRTERYTIIDLISNTGGLLGLFLGFSVISLLEIFYYFCIQPVVNRWKKRS